MKIKMLKSERFTTNPWSGGETTEFYIYPREANYKALDFDFRLSRASVAVETSVFTPLPEVARTLMVLEGNITLSHQNHHTKTLSKFDVDVFQGNWKTHCKGTCTDFNLMTRGATKGTLTGFSNKADEVKKLGIAPHWDWVFLYNYLGKTEIHINNQKNILEAGDMLVIENPDTLELQCKAIAANSIVICNIAQS